MRTRLGEITVENIITVLFLVLSGTFLIGFIIGLDHNEGPNLDLQNLFYGFLSYSFLLFVGLLMEIHFTTRNPHTDKDGEILKMKKKGHFIGCGDNPKDNECYHLNENVVTSYDRFFFEKGKPFNGKLFWFAALPWLGMIFLSVYIFLPFGIIFFAYDFFF